jgi:putative toxin-antitoxin system antitoxin component (TIGR02293 family)
MSIASLANPTVRLGRKRTVKAPKPMSRSHSTPRNDARFARLFVMAPLERASLVKTGVPSTMVSEVSKAMDVSKERFYALSGLSRATVTRKIAADAALTLDESERVVGIAKLIGQVQSIVNESGNPEGFEAGKWFHEWISRPVPALGGHKPEEYLQTADGREVVSKLIAQMQSGAYA